MESLRRHLQLLLHSPSSLARPSHVDRQLREVAASLASLLLPQETEATPRERQAWQEEAIELLLDAFCQAHAADHMSDHTKLGSWRLPYVAMLHSFPSLHLPLIRRLQGLVHSRGPSLTPVQCSALSTLMLFMNTYQVLKECTAKEVTQVSCVPKHASPAKQDTAPFCAEANHKEEQPAGIADEITNQEWGSERKEKRTGDGDYHVKPCFEWSWEPCYRAGSVALDPKQQEDTATNVCEYRQVPDDKLEGFNKMRDSSQNLRLQSVKQDDHWMDHFWEALPLDSDRNLLWAARFAVSYLRNVAVYWEHFILNNDWRETWLLPDLTFQLKSVNLVGPVFVAYIPTNLVVFLMWLQQRLNFAYQFDHSLDTAASSSGKKALALCDAVLGSPLGLLLRSTKLSLSLSKLVSLELNTGLKDFIWIKCGHQFLQYVVWGGMTISACEGSSWGLLWKEYGGDRKRACIDVAQEFLTSQGGLKECLLLEGRHADPVSYVIPKNRSGRIEDEDPPDNLYTGRKKQRLHAEGFDQQGMSTASEVGGLEANTAEEYILQLIMELSSCFSLPSEPWFLEVALGCIKFQEEKRKAMAIHRRNCACSHECMNRHVMTRGCSAHRLKSCIAALPPSHVFSQDRLDKTGKVFMYCWLEDGPFSLYSAGQLLPAAHLLKESILPCKVESQWSTILLACWVRNFTFVQPQLSTLKHMVGSVDLGSIMARLHSMQEFLTSHNKDVSQDIEGYKVAAKAMPQLAAVVLLEVLLTTSSCSRFPRRDCFMSTFAIKVSQRVHEMSGRVMEFLRKISKGPGLGEECHKRERQNSSSEGDVEKYFEILLHNVIALLSTGALTCPDLISTKWTTFEHKRRWVLYRQSWLTLKELHRDQDFMQVGAHDGIAVSRQELKSTSTSLTSLEVEFDERTGNLQINMWGVLIELAVNLITLSPNLINHLSIHTAPSDITEQKAAAVEAGSILGAGAEILDAITLCVIFAGLPRKTVVSMVQSEITNASWASLLSAMHAALENAFHQLSISNPDVASSDLSNTKVEMGSYLLKLQDVT